MTYKKMFLISYAFGISFSILLIIAKQYCESHNMWYIPEHVMLDYFFPIVNLAGYVFESVGEIFGRWTWIAVFGGGFISNPLIYSGIGCVILFMWRRYSVFFDKNGASEVVNFQSHKITRTADLARRKKIDKILRPILTFCGTIILTDFAIIFYYLYPFLFVHGVTDFNIVDVEFVQASTLDLHGDSYYLPSKLPPNHLLGKISVATKEDIHAMARRSNLSMGFDLTVCETGASVSEWPVLFFAGVEVTDKADADPINTLHEKRAALGKQDELYRYELYFDPNLISDVRMEPGQPSEYVPYDFSREPLELCLIISGGNMIGGGFASNLIRIPPDALARALQSAGR